MLLDRTSFDSSCIAAEHANVSTRLISHSTALIVTRLHAISRRGTNAAALRSMETGLEYWPSSWLGQICLRNTSFTKLCCAISALYTSKYRTAERSGNFMKRSTSLEVVVAIGHFDPWPLFVEMNPSGIAIFAIVDVAVIVVVVVVVDLVVVLVVVVTNPARLYRLAYRRGPRRSPPGTNNFFGSLHSQGPRCFCIVLIVASPIVPDGYRTSSWIASM